MSNIYTFLIICLLTTFNLNAQSTFTLTEKTKQCSAEPTQLSISQKTSIPTKVTVKYGTDATMTQSVQSDEWKMSHLITLENLSPSTFYHVQTITESETETYTSAPQIMATASTSTGEIRYFFLQGVDESFSNGSEPDGDQYPQVLQALYDLIDNAQETIDCAIYNTSWYELVDRLEEAVARGVQVRYIHDADTYNSALNGNLDFPILEGSPGGGIMHNKFMIVDAESETDSYVVTGSMNWTVNNITEDYNNTIIIQDKTLAMNYTIEFEEMWGSDGAQPDAANAKFGSQKADNTAHFFNVGGTEFECYFSPSDNVTTQIRNVINSADESLELAVLLMTRQDVATAIKDRYFQNVTVRGLFDTTSDAFEFLTAQNINVVHHYPSEMLHHKYIIADANNLSSNPTVLTGSHNWTNSAETKNDENTLIFKDANVANLFLQEFEKRWSEVVVSTFDISSFEDIKVFPNPFRENVNIQVHTPKNKVVSLQITNTLGQVIYTQNENLITGDNTLNLPTKDLANGIYYLTILNANQEYIYSQRIVKE